MKVLISTMNDIPGYQVTQVLGEVFGLTEGAATSVPSLGPVSSPWSEVS